MFNTILNSISNMSIFNMILLIFFIIGVIEGLYIFFTKFEKEITIDEKYTYGGNGINQSISDKENNIYVVRNSMFYLHWESLEVFNNMDTNNRYKISGYGIRVPVLGMFPIIVKAKSE